MYPAASSACCAASWRHPRGFHCASQKIKVLLLDQLLQLAMQTVTCRKGRPKDPCGAVAAAANCVAAQLQLAKLQLYLVQGKALE